MLDEVREAMADIPGIETSVEQPLAHLISAMLSGVQSQVAIKLYGDDLDTLRGKIRQIEQEVRPNVRRALAPDVLGALAREGATMSIDEAVAYALGLPAESIGSPPAESSA